ncbi:MAG TPA: preprotein translocase subunit SecA [Acidimicrobiia bacterium]|jgi:preprotein translocase subunit SecA|nr:preprotein translocase subunit SecA [Acidimicrobiia bacterium]
MGLFNKLLHAGEGKRLKAVQGIVPEVNAIEPEFERLSDDQLAGKTAEFKQRVDRARSEAKDAERAEEAAADVLDELLPEAFSVVREAGKRVLGQRHFDVQVMGGAALHLGWVAEMKTGEGKTLVATLPSYLNALAGRGVHVVTVNDYLAKRDAEWMGRLHRFLGLNVGVIIPDDSTPDEKRRQYDADIIYGTNNEFGFDYLRDNMVVSVEDQVMRGERNVGLSAHYFAIVDEVDSILIDEARTPLIISGRAADAAELYYQFARIARGLQRERDYEVDEAKRTVVPTEEGIARVEEALSVENLYENVHQNYVHQLQQALRGKELFKRDVDYIVQAGEVKIVDEFTGRILEGRRWSEGLHQAVEAKEGVKIKEENQTLATVTLQNYFRMYDKLSGMTGTAATEAGEFAHTYDLQVVSIPTNRDMVRMDQSDFIYKGEDAKFDAAVDDILERNEKGQPVLVGTISVEKSEKLSRALEKRGIPHEVLNAKQHEREAEIVTQAGKLGSVTVATNMAGRGVDILLGGNPEGLAKRECMKDGLTVGTPEYDARYAELLPQFVDECKAEGEKVRALGGLYVLGTERHESRRIDNQLRGRSGRQGDPGESRFYLSLEDELMRLFATGLMSRVMNASFPDDMPLESKMVSRAVERAQGTVEDRNFEIRKNVLKYDEVMNEQRKVIYKRRQQVLDGEDLREEAVEAITAAIGRLVDQYCTGEFTEEWDIAGLVEAAKSYFPMRITKEELDELFGSEAIEQALLDDALELYEAKEEAIGSESLRDIERRVLLSVLDQHWREHLYEMDYLQEGINLRAMGQQDPLAEWQREGFDMFEAMMGQIEDDFVRYVFHLQVVVEDEPRPDLRNVRYSAPEDPVQGQGSITAAMAAEPELPGEPPEMAMPVGQEPVQQQPVRVEKTPGRNDPCFCGSGKKYKLCHGR